MIHAENLRAGYSSGAVIEGLNFDLQEGLIHGVVGPNGSGKTTLLRVIAGQLDHEGGLTVFGQNPFDNPSVLDRTVLMGIDSPLPEGWNLRKVMAVGATRWTSWSEDRAQELCERFSIPLGKNYSALSRGQKSAVAIVFAVASGCELLILDEPYLGLDAEKREVFYQVLREEQGRTSILSTHHLNEAENLLDTVLLLKDGGGVVEGRAGELIDAILEVSGPAEQVDRVLSRLGTSRVLTRQESSLGSKALLDLRDKPELIDEVFAVARDIGRNVQVHETTLETAVLALEES